MELRQKFELRKLLVPALTQSLKILAMPLLDLRHLLEAELESNPFLEEEATAAPLPPAKEYQDN